MLTSPLITGQERKMFMAKPLSPELSSFLFCNQEFSYIYKPQKREIASPCKLSKDEIAIKTRKKASIMKKKKNNKVASCGKNHYFAVHGQHRERHEILPKINQLI
jgi:hypothetical protein